MQNSTVSRLTTLLIGALTLLPGAWLSAVANRVSFALWSLVAAAALLAVRWYASRDRRWRWLLGLVFLLTHGIAFSCLLWLHAEALELGVRAVAPALIVGAPIESAAAWTQGDLAMPLRPGFWGALGILVAVGYAVASRQRRLSNGGDTA